MRRTQQSAFASPVLIGAVTVLVVLVGVFLAYNADQGLPFVPTKELKVDIANGSDLVKGNDVREGGFRIGLVSALKPIQLSNGQVGAQLTLRLNKANGSVPIDSTATIRPRSVLGLKFVELVKGTSTQTIPDGGTLPISQTHVPVQFDEVLGTFDPSTRRAIQESLVGFGNTLAGRGSALNDTIAALPALFSNLEPVARYLSDPRTGLTRLLDSLNGFMGTVAPVARTASQLFTDMATTFEAISRDPSALEATIAESPSTLAVGTESLKVQQPFLADLTTLGHELTPATAELTASLPAINNAVAAGTHTFASTPQLNANLAQVLSALQTLASAPGTNVALNALTDTVTTLNPMLRYIGPYVTVCNSWNYWWTYFADNLSGFSQRVQLNVGDVSGKNSVGSLGATAPVNGTAGSDTSPVPFGGVEYFHGQAYGAAIDNQGNADCETGQRGYPKRLNAADPEHRNFATDPHTPGNQGPTFHGRARVPAGETFTRNPQTGPQIPFNPKNP